MFLKERFFWLFLVGILSGFSNSLWLSQHTISPSGKSSQNISPSPFYESELLGFVKNYLHSYYWDLSKIDEENLSFGASKGLYEAIGDPYTAVFPPKLFQELSSDITGNIAGIGVYLQKKGDIVSVLSFIPSSPASKSELRRGDQILSVNDIPTGNFSIEEISKQIQGNEGTSVILNIFRPLSQSYKSISIVRAYVSLPSVYVRALPNHFGYLKIVDFNDFTLKEIKKSLSQINSFQGLVMDLRDNPGGQIDVENEITSLFLPKNSLITSLISKNPKKKEDYRTSQKPLISLNIPIVILIGNQTASAGEILAAALRDNERALLVGEKTFGKGSVQTIFPLEYNGESFGVKITVAHYLTPKGQDINHVGILPDFKVSLPPITPLYQAKISYILNHSVLEKDLGKEFEIPLSSKVWNKIINLLKEKELSLPPSLLRRMIEEQKNFIHGDMQTIEWDFDTQLNKALTLLKNPKLYFSSSNSK